MTKPDKLYSLADLEWIISRKESHESARLAKQLADVMRENERLIALLDQRFKDGKRLGVIETGIRRVL